MNRLVSFLALLLLVPLASAHAATAKARPLVSPIFSDNMVLQRGKPNTFWGWAKPGQSVRVTISGKSAVGTAGADHLWQVKLLPPAVGGPYTVTISGPETVVLHNVLVGDVWLCGGQSNMQLGLGETLNAAAEIRAANHPGIRLFTVANHVSYGRGTAVSGTWKVCSPTTITKDGWGGFSAVAYYFGLKLHRDLKVPIGLIQDCVGGTPVESWMSPSSLRKAGGYSARLDEMDRFRKEGLPEYGSSLMHWLDRYDTGAAGATWGAPALDDHDWKPVTLAHAFDELGLGDEPGVAWFRLHVSLPNPLPAGPTTIRLGVVDKMDTVYVNDHWTGASSWVENPRVYPIGAGVLHPGDNLIAIRIFKLKGPGFRQPDQVRLVLGNGTSMPLAGPWRGRLSVDARPPHPLPLDFENFPTMPAVLFQGMIEPLAPLAISGAIWYQGESNADQASRYRSLLTAMIGDWRTVFEQGNFPFYIVSLPAFMHRSATPTDDGWTDIREAQAQVAATVPNSALAVTVDTGEADNIHPKLKQPVGDRLALCALAHYYKLPVVCSGPVFASLEHQPGALRLRFTHANGGLVVHGQTLGEFSVAGSDRVWHWATAKIDGDCVIVSSPEVHDPVAARYAWQANPEATLFNGAGLPAVPFRTDTWPEATEAK